MVPAENNPRPKYEHNRAERVTLDSGDSKDLYESIPIAEDRIDFQIHEIGEGNSFYLKTKSIFVFILKIKNSLKKNFIVGFKKRKAFLKQKIIEVD